MKFWKVFCFSAAFVACVELGAFVSSDATCDKNTKKTPVNTGKYVVCPHIKVQYDTVNVTDKMIKNFGIISAGTFHPNSGRVLVSYFQTDSRNPLTRRFCDVSNTQIRLVQRHEMEHARKANLTKNVGMYSPAVRAAIAAQNEIMAPAAEIIEAMDYRYKTGAPYPSQRSYILNADAEIMDLSQRENLAWPLDYNDTRVADIVMKHAATRFFSEIKRGVYRNTLVRAAQPNTKFFPYITNDMCDPCAVALFNPGMGMWAPLWQFQSLRGDVNLWNAASASQRDAMMDSVASIVHKFTGQKLKNYKNTKTR